MSLFTVGRSGLLAPVAPCGWWPAEAGVAYGADPAALGFRNDHGVVNFDDTVEEAFVFHGVAPAALGSNGLVVSLDVMAASAVIGSAVFSVAIERVELAVTDIDSDAFGPGWTTEVAVSGTSGVPTRTQVSFSFDETGGLVAGDPYRVLVKRKVDDSRDDLVGDAQILRVFLEESDTVLISKTAATILAALLLSWHDMSDSNNYTLVGSKISQIDDLTSNGHDFFQNADATRPVFAAGGLGGQDSANFINSLHWLESSTAPVSAAGFYVWVSTSAASILASTFVLAINRTSSNDGWGVAFAGTLGGDPVYFHSWVSSGGAATSVTGYSIGVSHVIRGFEESATSRFVWLDGAGVGTNVDSRSPTGVNHMWLGRWQGGQGIDGHVGEVAVANATGITPQQISDMDVLTAHKWGAATPP